MKNRNLLTGWLICWFGATAFAAAPPAAPITPGSGNTSNGSTGGQSVQASSDCNVGASRADLDINNVRARYMNQGDMFWDPGLSQARYEVPKRTDNFTTSKHSMFAAAIWLGGLERGSGNLIVMAQTYRENGRFANYWPGPLKDYNPDLTTYTSPRVCAAWDQLFKCNRKTVKDFVSNQAAGLITDCEQIPAEIRFWPGKGNPYLKQKSEFSIDPEAVASVDNNLANFYDADSNGIYNPCQGDYPLWAGTEKDLECEGTEININSGADQVLWWVCNDIGNKKGFPDIAAPFVPGLGMEVHYEAFAYAATDATNDMTFLRQRLFNKGNYILDQTYLAQWADPDLGNASDDYVGCDVMRGLGICYNGDDFDEGTMGYGENPPAIGVDFFRGPFPDDKFDNIDWDLDCDGPGSSPPDTNERIVMSGFIYYNIGGNPINGDPRLPSEFYNYLRNRWKNGNDISFGGAGLEPVSPNNPKAVYMFPNVTEQSDPFGFACGNRGCEQPRSCGAAWNEKTANNPPGDRRFLANNGPFTLKPGAKNECTIGIVWARANSGGATGSFGKLLAADDLAQDRFNTCFKRNIGPNSPNLEISEIDRKLVFTIVPDVIVPSPLMTTESYLELNRSVTGGPNNEDVYFRFQGYKIFQLKDDKVSVQDLDNPDRARPLDADVNGDGVVDFNGIMDVADGVTSISNIEFNPDLNQDILTPKVKNTPDKGIFRTFQVERDMFSSISGGKLSNFKKYYYAVVAYGYNKNSQAKRPYIQGVENYKIFTAIPHKFNPESFGTTSAYGFGSSFEVTRVNGTGNSGNLLQLKEGQRDRILTEGKVDRVTYKAGNGPIDFKVYNPKALKGGKFRMTFSNRIRYNINAGYAFKVGDIIESDDNFVPDAGYRISPRFDYRKGVARVRRVVPVNGFPTLVDLDIESFSCEGGSFSFQMDRVERDRSDTILVDSKSKGARIFLQGDPTKNNVVQQYFPFDYWTLVELGSGKETICTNPVSSLSEEIIPDYGIAVRPKNGITPGSDVFNGIEKNGALNSIIQYDPDRQKQWLYDFNTAGVSPSWIRDDKYATGNIYQTLDPFRSFRNQAGGSWAPYALTTAATSLTRGPMFAATNSFEDDELYYANGPKSVFRNMSLLKNVDIVFTSDTSKWTRVVVLQCDTIGASSSNRPKWTMAKSRRPSVNKRYQRDGSVSPFGNLVASRGMSWFPGYAVDLDRGQRLNMMFSESILEDTSGGFGNPYNGAGNDLKWEPRANLGLNLGTRNYIYVLNTAYDACRETERSIDSLFTNFSSQSPQNFNPRVWNWYMNNVMYVGLMGRNIDFINAEEFSMNLNQIEVNLRVQRAFEPFAHGGLANAGKCDPVYEFEIPADASQRNVTSVGSSALDMIRVVPNPYLSVSEYESSQIDNRVKIVNIPSQCVVSIFNLSGSLIRQYNFDQTNTKPYAAVGGGELKINERGTNYQTFLDWDLKNQNGLPIASGVYIIHIKSDKLGEKVIKWFGILRPIDLDTFN